MSAYQPRMMPTLEMTNSAASTHFAAENANRLPGLKPRVRNGLCSLQMRLWMASEQTSLCEKRASDR